MTFDEYQELAHKEYVDHPEIDTVTYHHLQMVESIGRLALGIKQETYHRVDMSRQQAYLLLGHILRDYANLHRVLKCDWVDLPKIDLSIVCNLGGISVERECLDLSTAELQDVGKHLRAIAYHYGISLSDAAEYCVIRDELEVYVAF
ncbi:hypothetical protein NSQ26_09640 [Bacillus sp. FSL W7-1360]